MKELLKKANELLQVQGNFGNWKYDNYMTGMYNGMELIISVLEERDTVYKECQNNDVQKAMKILTEALREDEGYYIGWQANIAMAFKDEFVHSLGDSYLDYDVLHEIANDASKNFLNLLMKEE